MTASNLVYELSKPENMPPPEQLPWGRLINGGNSWGVKCPLCGARNPIDDTDKVIKCFGCGDLFRVPEGAA